MSLLPKKNTGSHPAKQLRAHLQKDGTVMVPGAFDGLTALIAQRAGFEALYFSGGAYTASLGIPDLGLITLNEVATQVRWITRAVNLPLIVDVDTGFGEVLNIVRTVQDLEAAGAAAIQLEDQVNPKRCGHLEGKQLVSAEAMAEKVRAAAHARTDMVIIARTDARAVEGMDEAVRRAKLYYAAGADVIFPEALQSKEEFRQFAEAVDVPLLANMTEFGKTPYLSASEFEELGYKFVIYPVTSLRIAARAIENAFESLKQEGTQEQLLEKMLTRKELYELIGYSDYAAFDEVLKQNQQER